MPGLRRPGETSEEAVVVGQLGMLYRIGSTIEQVGVVAYGNLQPRSGGSGADGQGSAIVELLAGGVWMEEAPQVSSGPWAQAS